MERKPSDQGLPRRKAKASNQASHSSRVTLNRGKIPMEPRELQPMPVTQTTYHQLGEIYPPKRWQNKVVLCCFEPIVPVVKGYHSSYQEPHDHLKPCSKQRNESCQREHRPIFPTNRRIAAPTPTDITSSIAEPQQLDETESMSNLTKTPQKSPTKSVSWGGVEVSQGTPSPDSTQPKQRWHKVKGSSGDQKQRFKAAIPTEFRWKSPEPLRPLNREDDINSFLFGKGAVKRKADKGKTYCHFLQKTTNESASQTNTSQQFPSRTSFKGQFQRPSTKLEPISHDLPQGSHTTVRQDRHGDLEVYNIKQLLQQTFKPRKDVPADQMTNTNLPRATTQSKDDSSNKPHETQQTFMPRRRR